jgi:hypothetical protein
MRFLPYLSLFVRRRNLADRAFPGEGRRGM